MTRIMFATTIVCLTLSAVASSEDPPKAAPVKLAGVYVKLIWPINPANPPVVDKARPVVESWIDKSIKDRPQVGFMAMSVWVPLIDESCDEPAIVWDGKVSDEERVCHVSAYISERKNGKIKILLNGPSAAGVAVTLDDEPGGREVAPVTNSKTNYGTPHVAIFIGPKVE